MHSDGHRIALVTGGTSGIGRCVARGLRDDGFTVVVMARALPRLESMAEEGFIVARGDVSDDQSVKAWRPISNAASPVLMHWCTARV